MKNYFFCLLYFTSLFINIEQSVDDLEESFDLPHIEHGAPIIDKKSVFQAHLVRITSEKQVCSIQSCS